MRAVYVEALTLTLMLVGACKVLAGDTRHRPSEPVEHIDSGRRAAPPTGRRARPPLDCSSSCSRRPTHRQDDRDDRQWMCRWPTLAEGNHSGCAAQPRHATGTATTGTGQ